MGQSPTATRICSRSSRRRRSQRAREAGGWKSSPSSCVRTCAIRRSFSGSLSPIRSLPQPSLLKGQKTTTKTQRPQRTQSGIDRDRQDRQERRKEPGFSIQWPPSIPVACPLRILVFFVLFVLLTLSFCAGRQDLALPLA